MYQMAYLMLSSAFLCYVAPLARNIFLHYCASLQPASQANFIVKYANDTYVIIPAGNISSGPAELTNTSQLGT